MFFFKGYLVEIRKYCQGRRLLDMIINLTTFPMMNSCIVGDSGRDDISSNRPDDENISLFRHESVMISLQSYNSRRTRKMALAELRDVYRSIIVISNRHR